MYSSDIDDGINMRGVVEPLLRKGEGDEGRESVGAEIWRGRGGRALDSQCEKEKGREINVGMAHLPPKPQMALQHQIDRRTNSSFIL